MRIMIRIGAALLSLSLLSLVGGCSGAADAGESANEDAVAAAGASALGEEAYRIYADVARAEGSAPTPDTVTVIGLRGLSFDGEIHATTYAHAYDDTFVVLRKDGKVERFPGATHPHQARAPGVPDADRDGQPDVGMIRPGLYEVVPRDRKIAGQPSYPVLRNGSERLPGWRDTSHDGVLDEAERARSERRGDYLTAVLFHNGDGDAPPAIGCQVLPQDAMPGFVRAVGGPRARFRYVLVDVAEWKGEGDPRDLPR